MDVVDGSVGGDREADAEAACLRSAHVPQLGELLPAEDAQQF